MRSDNEDGFFGDCWEPASALAVRAASSSMAVCAT
jgi:hypothetical protein